MRARPFPQYAVEPVGIMTYSNGALTDPDTIVVSGNTVPNVTLTIYNSDTNTIIVPSGTLATQESTGTFQYLLNSNETAVQGNYIAHWSYTISGSPRFYDDPLVITDQMPYWSNLTYDERQIVTGIVHRLDKSFDSTAGGPYLQELRQSGFIMYEEVAMIMTNEAIDYINYEFQPVFNPAYEIGLNALVSFPSNWYGVLATQTYAHFLKHIARNYIEQPTPQGMTAAWMDRRDYYNRWWQLYIFDKEIADKQLRQMKRQFMVGSKRSLLVAGGLIPRMFVNPSRPHFQYAAVNMGGV
jgi:hypothetical protein